MQLPHFNAGPAPADIAAGLDSGKYLAQPRGATGGELSGLSVRDRSSGADRHRRLFSGESGRTTIPCSGRRTSRLRRRHGFRIDPFTAGDDSGHPRFAVARLAQIEVMTGEFTAPSGLTFVDLDDAVVEPSPAAVLTAADVGGGNGGRP